MATAVEMPKLSDTMEEGVVSAWMAEEGDEVSAGDVIAQVETDKATMDLEVFDDGVLLKKVADEGETVPLGQLLAVLGEEGEDISDLLEEHGANGAATDAEETEAQADEEKAEAESEDEAQEEKDEEAEAEADQEEQTAEASEDSDTEEEDAGTQRATSEAEGKATEEEEEAQPAASENGRIKASPLARRMAGENEIDLGGVEGSGPQGRIVKRDIEAILSGDVETQRAASDAPATPQEAPSGDGAFERPAEVAPQSEEELYEAESISQMRKAIARRLAASKYTAPHFYLTIEVDAARLMAVREELNELAEAQERARLSVNDLITKACAVALKAHPQVNASYLEDEGEIRRYRAVHVGVAVAVEEGLITPVIRNADRKGLAQIAEETKELAGQAREGNLQPQDYEGATFTTSNLGPWGIEEFTAIINPPNACILAIGAIREVPVVEGGEVVPGQRMKLTLSCDHRIVDGATGADFLDTLQGLLEEPMGLLL